MSKALFVTLFVLMFLIVDLILVIIAILTLGDKASIVTIPGGFALGWYSIPAYRWLRLRLVDAK